MFSFNSSNNLHYSMLTKILLFLFLEGEVSDLKLDDIMFHSFDNYTHSLCPIMVFIEKLSIGTLNFPLLIASSLKESIDK